jgi:hypothetical protein
VQAFRIGWKAVHDDLAATPGRSFDDVLDDLLGVEAPREPAAAQAD